MMKPVPDSCWYSNLRSALPKKIWDILRHDAYDRAGGKCMICGRKTTRLEAHEDWSYDEKNCVQKLDNILALCHDCHAVIHIGRTQLYGDEDRAIAHFCKEYHKRLNRVPEWKLDVDFITDVLKRHGVE